MAHHDDGGVGHAYGDGEYGLTPAGAGHEHTDANVWIIVKFMLWLAVAAIIIHIGMGFVFALFVAQREEAVAVYPLATGQPRLPAGARLQTIPVNEITVFRRQEEQVLNSYGWIDRAQGRVQIPIDAAMRLVVERGLPVRAAQPEAAPEAAAAGPAAQGAATADPAAQGGAEAPGAPAVQAPGAMPSDASAGRVLERRQ
jgi:hypothetical protein